MNTIYTQEQGNETLWVTIFQDGHPDLMKQQWLHRKMPHEPRCRMCYSPFEGIGGWWQRTFRHRAPSSRNPYYCAACDAFINQFPGGAEVDMSVLFIDIRLSTQYATSTTPELVNHRVNHFLDQATKIITEGDGFIMAFYGDCVVAVWPPGFSGSDHAQKALSAAQALTKYFATELTRDHIPVGIGCHTGRVFIGTVNAGKGLFRDVSIFGQNVILAARLAAKAEPFQALISDDCWQAVSELPTSELSSVSDIEGLVSLKGFDAPIKIHSVNSKEIA